MGEFKEVTVETTVQAPVEKVWHIGMSQLI
ncbi:hypothetical protein UACE39S_05089 [Ureibacillus acetophenoni]